MSEREEEKMYFIVGMQYIIGSLFTAIGCIIVLSTCISILIRILVSFMLAINIISLLIFVYACAIIIKGDLKVE